MTKDFLQGTEAIKHALKSIGQASGVYKMIAIHAGQEEILYIGKAKNLSNRITNYTHLRDKTNRIINMIMQVNKIEVITTDNESEALLLEMSLINKHKPPYNILLKDDKSFPYIAIDMRGNFPRIFKHRGKRLKGIKYFGPYPTVWAVNNAIDSLQKAFLIRSCNDSYFRGRTRACLEYEIKKCTAPCVNYISKDDYKQAVIEVTNFLNGKASDIKQEMQQAMLAASSAMEYEKAAKIRDRISALSALQVKQNIFSQNVINADILGLSEIAGQYCVNVTFIRNNQTFGSNNYFPQNTDLSNKEEILEYFIVNFYNNHISPKEIIVSESLTNYEQLQNILNDRLNEDDEANYKVKITHPQKGERKKLLELSSKNAKLALEAKLNKGDMIYHHLQEIKKLFKISEDIRRIEIFDNSHIFGQNAIGGMVVAGFDEEMNWGFLKNHYRKFNVDSGEKNTGGDDFYMMQQVLTRRYSKLADIIKTAKINSNNSNPHEKDINSFHKIENLPQLIIIDGGLGQMKIAKEVFAELGIEDCINYIGMAKGEDRNAGDEDIFNKKRELIKLPKDSPILYFLQNLRDEAHRFAITGHRTKRKHNLTLSELDEIPNIGAKRKKALLGYFGSVRNIKESDISELAKVEGINKKTAEDIYYWFRER